jgi:hypothetical protein
MTRIHETPPWTDPTWLDEIRDWILSETQRLGQSVSGPIEQIHERPWSVVYRVPISDRVLIFKASADILSHEAGLTQALARLCPSDLPAVLSSNPERGWVLMEDGGAILRAILRADRDVGNWEKLLPQYARLQIAIAAHLDELKMLGIPDRSLARLPALYEELLGDEANLLVGKLGGLSSAEHHRLIDHCARVAMLCEQLQAAPIPVSIHHGDLHDGNIFHSEQSYRFFDWGDASISHPFFSLRTVSVSLEITLEWEQNSPAFNSLRDVYLEAWGEFGSADELLDAFKLARCLSPLCSALSWHRVVSSLSKSTRLEYEQAIPGLLQEYLAEEARLID